MHGATTQSGERAAKQAFSLAAYAWRDRGIGVRFSPPRGNRSRHFPKRCQALHRERQRRVTTKGEAQLTRQSYQQGYVSDPIRTRRGLVFRIRYRLRKAAGYTNPKPSKIFQERRQPGLFSISEIRESQNRPLEAVNFTVQHVVDALWRPSADVYTHTSADANRSAALALGEAIFGDLFQVVPRFGTWNKNAAPN